MPEWTFFDARDNYVKYCDINVIWFVNSKTRVTIMLAGMETDSVCNIAKVNNFIWKVMIMFD